MADVQSGRHTYEFVNHRSTVHQVRESEIYRELTIGWRTREGMSNTTGRKWEMRYIFNSKNNLKEKPRESMEPENKNKNIQHQRPKTKHRLEVAGNSIIVRGNRDRDEMNGGDDDGKSNLLDGGPEKVRVRAR